MSKSTALSQLPWNDLVALLRAYGLSRHRADTKRTMAERIAAHLGEAPAQQTTSLQLTDVLLLQGAAGPLEHVLSYLHPSDVRFLSPHALAVPVQRAPALRRALRRAGEPELAGHPTSSPSARVDPSRAAPELVAAALFVTELAQLLGWPELALGDQFRRLQPSDPSVYDTDTRRWLELWRRLFDNSLDGDDATTPSATDGPFPEVPQPRPELRQILDEAIRSQRCVELHYRTAFRGAWTRRVVEPLALQTRQRVEYLHGYCRWRAAQRVFRLTRIHRCVPLAERFGVAASDAP